MSNLPSTQRAWQIVSKGSPSKVLRLAPDLSVPIEVPPGNVLIKVHAGALNPVDYKLMGLLPNFVAGRPTTPAYELSGTIVDGNGTEWRKGDEVVAHFPIPQTFKTKQGALMEYTYAPANVIVKRPEHISPIGAAGVALTGQTAWQALYDIAGLEEGQSVFINGGSTAVGSFAIQFAKAKGCRVTATASGKNEQYVRDLGADEFIDYTKVDLSKHLSENPPATKYHVFFETVGLLDNSLYLRSENYIAPGGYFIHVGPQPKGMGDVPQLLRLGFEWIRPAFLGGVKRNFRIITCKPKQDDMNAIFALIAEGKVRTLVDSVFEFEDAVKAYERLMSSRATGKVIVKVEPDIA